MFENITRDFITEYFGSKYLEIFNIKELTKSSMPNFIKLIKQYKKSPYSVYDIINVFEGNPTDIDLKYMKIHDYIIQQIEVTYFINHYPFFQNFLGKIEEMSKDTIPNGDCSGTCDLQEISYKYNMKIYKFSKELFWSPKNHKYYSKKTKLKIIHLIWCWKYGENICKLPRDILYLIISKLY